MIKRQAQTTLEYSILIIVIMGAFLAMSTYVKRGVQGRWKEAVDDLGEQYDPLRADGGITYFLNSVTDTEVLTEPVAGGFVTKRYDRSNSLETQGGSLRVWAE